MSDVAAAPLDSVADEEAPLVSDALEDAELSADEVSDAAEDAVEDWSVELDDDDPLEQAVIATAARMAISDVVSKRMYFSL